MFRIFGKKEDREYYDRPGAYILPVENDLIYVVRTPKGLFLIGGKIEEGETECRCIERECLEETGYSVTDLKKIGFAETYTTHSELGAFHPIQHYYLCRLKDKIKTPIEADHELLRLPYSEVRGRMFSEMQNWAVDLAFETK